MKIMAVLFKIYRVIKNVNMLRAFYETATSIPY